MVRVQKCLVLLSLVALGCSGERSEKTMGLGSGERDASVGDGGAVVDADMGTMEAGEPDGEVAEADGAAPDAEVPLTGFRLSVRSYGEPMPGYLVVLHGEDGAVLEQLETGADGSVFSADVPAMATVALSRDPDSYRNFVKLLTFMDVELGDHIVVALEQQEQSQNEESETVYRAQVQVPWPEGTGSVDITAGTSCVSGYTPTEAPVVAVNEYDGCRLPSADNVLLATAYHQESFGPAAFAYARGVPRPTEGGADVSLSDWVAPTVATLGITGTLPETVLESLWGRLQMNIDGRRFYAHERDDAYLPDPVSFWIVPEVVTSFEATVDYAWPDGSSRSQVSSLPVDDEVAIEVGAQLPNVESLALTAEDPTRPVIATELEEGTIAADALYIIVQWRYETNVRWGFVTSPARGSFTVPELPAELAPLFSAAGQEPYVFTLTMVGSDAVADYDAFRSRPFEPTQNSEPRHTFEWRLGDGENAQLATWWPPI